MVQMTKNGVVYDVEHSPFTFERNGFLFKFSSDTHLRKFMRDVVVKEEWLNDSLSRRFKVQVKFDLLADIQLYQQIEKRGFYIYDILSEEGYDDICQVLYRGMLHRLPDSEKQLHPTTEQLIG